MSDIIMIAGESLSRKFLDSYFHGKNIIRIKECYFGKYRGTSYRIEFRNFHEGLERRLKFHSISDANSGLNEIIEFMKGR